MNLGCMVWKEDFVGTLAVETANKVTYMPKPV